MTFGVESFGVLSFGEIVGAGVPNPVTQAWEAQYGRVFLYELTAYKRGGAGDWNSPFGADPWGALPESALITGEAIFRFSDAGYISKPADIVANTNFDPSIQTGLRLTRTTPASPEAARRVNLDLGSFSIANGDGEMDTVVATHSVDGRLVRVLLGLDTFGYSQFTPIFTGRIRQWGNDGKQISVDIRDESYRLEKPLQPDLYDGSGGLNGNSNVSGMPRPLAFGEILGIDPPQIDSSNLVYQFHSRAALAVDAVYDRGAALTPDTDYPDYASLIGASLSTGEFATCLELGLFRLGSTPSGLITADVRGDSEGGYIDTTAGVGDRIIKDFGGISDAELDAASWADFETATPGVIGWWQGPSAITVAAALEQIFGHCAGWWGSTPEGLFQIGRLAEPSAELYVLDVIEDDMIKMEILPPLSGTFPPRFRQRVGYQRLFRPQQDTDIAGSVSDARRNFLAQEYRTVSSEDLAVQGNYLLATDPAPLVSLFQEEADAQSLADYLLDLHKADRQTIRVTLDLKGLGARLGASIRITHGRIDGGSPKVMRVIDISIVADRRQVELVLWG